MSTINEWLSEYQENKNPTALFHTRHCMIKNDKVTTFLVECNLPHYRNEHERSGKWKNDNGKIAVLQCSEHFNIIFKFNFQTVYHARSIEWDKREINKLRKTSVNMTDSQVSQLLYKALVSRLSLKDSSPRLCSNTGKIYPFSQPETKTLPQLCSSEEYVCSHSYLETESRLPQLCSNSCSKTGQSLPHKICLVNEERCSQSESSSTRTDITYPHLRLVPNATEPARNFTNLCLHLAADTIQQETDTDFTQQQAEANTIQQEAEADTTQQEAEADTTQQEAEADTIQQEAEADTTQQEPKADTTQQEAEADTTQQEAEADTTQQEAEADTTQQEAEADTTQQEAEADTIQQEAEADTTQQEPKADTTQQEAEADTTQQEAEADTTQQEPKADTTQQEAEADTTQQEAEADTTQQEAEADTIQQEAEADTIQQEAEADTTQQEAEADTIQQEAEADTIQQEPKADTTQQEPKADTTQQEAEADTTQQEAEADTTQQEPKADTTQQEPKADTTQQEAEADTTQQEAEADTTQQEAEADTMQQEAEADTTQQEADTDSIHQQAEAERRAASLVSMYSHPNLPVAMRSHSVLHPNIWVLIEDENYDPLDPENRTVEHPTTDLETLIHLMKGSLGSGILAMPVAFKSAGLIFGLFATFFVGFICAYSIHILVKCSHILCKKVRVPCLGFDDIAEVAFFAGPEKTKKFAKTGRFMVNIFLVLDLVGCCCVYIVFVARNTKQIIDYNFGKDFDVRMIMFAVLPFLCALCLIRNLKYLAPFSLVANCLMAAGVGITFYYILTDVPPINERPKFSSVGELPIFFGTCIFALEGIGVVMPLENNMKTPKHFLGCCGVLNIGMAFVVALYASLGFFGYLKYGEATEASITLNLPDTVLAQSVKGMIAGAIFLTYALQFHVPLEIIWKGIKHKFARHPLLVEYILRVSLVVFTVLVAAACPHLGPAISLVGALCLSFLGLLFPAIVEIVVRWEQGLGRLHWLLWKNLAIIVFGFVGLITGSYVSILEIRDTFLKHQHHHRQNVSHSGFP